MIHLLLLLFAVVVVFAAGYACRGWVRREMGWSYNEALSWKLRIEAALSKGEAELRAEASNLLAEIRAKLKL